MRSFFRKIHVGAAVGTAIFLVAVWWIVFCMIGTPRRLLYFLSGCPFVLPSWMLILLLFVFFALSGFCVGAVLFAERCTDEISKYRGAFFFSIAITAGYLWYAMTFGAALFLPAILLAAVMVAGLVITAVNFSRCSCVASKGMWIAAGWGVYLLVFSVVWFLFF